MRQPKGVAVLTVLLAASLAVAGCRGTEPGPERVYRLGANYVLATIDGKPLPWAPRHDFDRGSYERTLSGDVVFLSDSELVSSIEIETIYKFSPTDIHVLDTTRLVAGFTYARRGNEIELSSWPENQVHERFSMTVRHGALVHVTGGAVPRRFVYREAP